MDRYAEDDKEKNVKRFLELIRKQRIGKFKIYIGMSAGVGKTYRMLQEAHSLLKTGIDVQIGYIETHQRKETEELVVGLPVIPRKTFFYKGKALDEMDLQTIINLHPEVVIVDELAHSNSEGSKNEKRWQDVLEILEAGINVISAVNIQHIESLNDEVKAITGIEVKERVPDKVIALADEVVNIDLTADELIDRLREGKIYPGDKIASALKNFFQSEHILQLRELALKEVAAQVERKVEIQVPKSTALRKERFLACISSNEKTAKQIIRKTARLASYYNCKWFVLYVQTPIEKGDKIALDKQRHLINNYKLATELGAEIVIREGNNIARTIAELAEEKAVTTICIGKPNFNFIKFILAGNTFNELLKKLQKLSVDVILLS